MVSTWVAVWLRFLRLSKLLELSGRLSCCLRSTGTSVPALGSSAGSFEIANAFTKAVPVLAWFAGEIVNLFIIAPRSASRGKVSSLQDDDETMTLKERTRWNGFDIEKCTKEEEIIVDEACDDDARFTS